MTDHIHPADKHDALDFALKELRFRAPQGGYSEQIDRNRLHILEQMREQALRESRT